jgi:hypothetical protein
MLRCALIAVENPKARVEKGLTPLDAFEQTNPPTMLSFNICKTAMTRDGFNTRRRRGVAENKIPTLHFLKTCPQIPSLYDDQVTAP